jgi:hypothetical protein
MMKKIADGDLSLINTFIYNNTFCTNMPDVKTTQYYTIGKISTLVSAVPTSVSYKWNQLDI